MRDLLYHLENMNELKGLIMDFLVFALMDSLAIQKILQPYLTMIGMKLRIEKSLKKKRPSIA